MDISIIWKTFGNGGSAVSPLRCETKDRMISNDGRNDRFLGEDLREWVAVWISTTSSYDDMPYPWGRRKRRSVSGGHLLHLIWGKGRGGWNKRVRKALSIECIALRWMLVSRLRRIDINFEWSQGSSVMNNIYLFLDSACTCNTLGRNVFFSGASSDDRVHCS